MPPVSKRGKKSRPSSAVDTPVHLDAVKEAEPLANFRTSGINNLHTVAKPFKCSSEFMSTRRWKNLKQVVAQEQTQDWPVAFPTYWSIDAPPSLIPQKKYCDVTGLPAKYTDPKTNVRYHSAEVYQIVKSLPPGSEQQYLALRNASVVLK
ncbi:chromatin-remodeling complex subunit ies6 [Coemansia thaxteri]|uniref:Chromatin-remodeling complex subunit ies6 n=1 Tax=Coemansia thaxteri TaxID=2663907 RepID=A0A9W8BK18_9FUNG|nr:chromatin-remodeling complex subunit ies6 [Coemansia thaxteri]KAJ2007872.1 chromatin-remodeling complex subunit ies6 [Coemansia thaxteri]KAJ2472738.1 chromatin-remodeling complex subunit ies6 [Coemansia sp. RSA 2322]KAJ2487453.1 chromatin-remodeling complex subunit ies6 [Coemansia sp. RSA 2320]